MKTELKFDELGNVFEMGFDDVTTIHGKDGKDGQDGKDGYTPVKGVDYYTEAEKKELVTEVTEDVKTEIPTKVSQLENDKNYVTKEETESFVHSDTLASDYYSANYIDNIVNEVSDILSTNETAILALREDIDNKFEKWEKVVDIEITEPISTSFRQEFGKQFKKIRFKIEVKGTGTATIRFKRDINDGGAGNYGTCNFLKITSVNLSTMRYIVGTAYFDLDNFICIKDGIYGTQTCTLSTGSTTVRSDVNYAEEMQFFDEIFFHFGADCTVSSGKIEVWGCEV